METASKVFKILSTAMLASLLLLPALKAQNATDWDDMSEPASVEERRILTTLQEERENLRQERNRLAEREEELKVLRQEVEEKMEQLEERRRDLEEILAEKEEEERQRVEKLSRIYQRMDPDRAAAALNDLDRDLAVEIVSGMRDGTAADVLDSMEREDAAALSADLSRLEAE